MKKRFIFAYVLLGIILLGILANTSILTGFVYSIWRVLAEIMILMTNPLAIFLLVAFMIIWLMGRKKRKVVKDK